MFIFSNQLLADFRIKAGTYLMPKCFFKIEEEEQFIKIQFAHEDQHLLRDADYPDKNPFHPDYILGTNIVYDKMTKTVEFGPDKCIEGSVKRIQSNVSDKVWEIRCGGLLSKVHTYLKIYINRDGFLRKYRFKESYNQYHQGRISWPWQRKVLYNYSCSGLQLES
tara:strand:+ start:415 stop:909 length:495 start_codon:yes stop_codon:yes gene_type:complete